MDKNDLNMETDGTDLQVASQTKNIYRELKIYRRRLKWQSELMRKS